MKLLYTLLAISLLSLSSQAQNFNLTFEDTTVINQVFYTDSTLDPQGIWQIGVPHKSFMNAAYSPTNGVTTMLDSLLPPGSRASFIITAPNVEFSATNGGFLSFVHRYEFDTAHGGGYVEFSVDTGHHWHGIFSSFHETCDNAPWNGQGNGLIDTIDGQIIPMPAWWDTTPRDTLLSGIHYFTGTDSVWAFDTIAFPTFFFAVKTNQITQIMFRFTAFTDSASASLGGWLIDNIQFNSFGFFCGGGINEVNSSHLKVNPIPATSAFNISMLDEPESDYTITVSDISGRVILTQRFTGQETLIQRGDIDAGSYFIQVTDKRTQNTFQKRMVFE